MRSIHLERIIDFHTKSIQNMLIFGDLNMKVTEPAMQLLYQQYSLFSMIRSPTCFKRPQGKYIDLMLTNSKHSFFGSQTFETGFSDFHEMIYTILKTTYTKLPPKIIQYRDYNKFSETDFLMDLSNALCSMIPENCNEFEGQVGKILDKHAPYKKATIRGNNKPHVSKEMRKEIMCRTRFKSIANKTRNEEDIRRCKRQRNEIIKLKKIAKKRYFRSLDPATIGGDKSF